MKSFASRVVAHQQARRKPEKPVLTRHPFPSRALALALMILLSGLGMGVCQSAATAADATNIIQFLNQTIGWYRQLDVERQMATEPNDVMVVNENSQIADQIVRLAFDFARAETESIANQASSNQIESPSADSSQYQPLLQFSGKLDKQVQESKVELESLRRKLEAATGRQRQALQSEIAETQSELELAEARREALRSMLEFVQGTSTNGLGASGLRAQIEALARYVPATLTKPSTGKESDSSAHEPFNPAPALGTHKPEPSGIWGLAGDLFVLSRKIHTLAEAIQLTDALAQRSKELRTPLVTTLKELSQRGDELAKQADSAEPTLLAQEKKELDALTAKFKQASAAALPLSKEVILLGVYKRSLANWQGTIQRQYAAELRSLLLRLSFLGIILVVVIGVAELWRRTIFRYVQDTRRRYQFLLLRKIVLWFLIAIIVAFAFANELGSVATFAGLLTAGIAVALQNVILSLAGYFFLIGKYGIRAGDRVQIAGVTGEVVDVGLVRLHLMELGSGGAEAPSGRVVAFSNSIVFQPTAGLFKQIPGTNFVWHEITLTLSPDSDYGSVEERLRGAVEAVFSDYRADMERQRRQMQRTFTSTPVGALEPISRLRLTPSGLEVVIRYPVDLQNAAEIDDRVTRELLKAIDREPKLKLIGSGTASLRLRTDLSTADTTPG
jgi:small-conductance mechanosensitive channel